MPEKLLERSQVEEVIQFAQDLWAIEKYGYYSPWTQNQLLNNLNNNPKIPTYKSIAEALSSYKQSADTLQDYMEFMQKFDMIFARTLMSYVNMLSFDLTITCKNAFTKEDYQSKEYQEDKKKIYNQLKSKKAVLFGAKTSSGKQHWVVITGFTGSTLSASNFKINDPGSKSRTTLKDFLNEYPSFYKFFYY